MRIMSASTMPPKKPEIAPNEHADDRGDRRGGEADLERDLAAVHDPAEDVEAGLVGAEQVPALGRRVLVGEEQGVLGAGLVRVVEERARRSRRAP